LATTTWEWLNLNLGRSQLASFAQKNETLASLLDAQVRLRPNATMIVTAQSEISWAQFASLSHKIANILSANGVQKGEAVALNMENGILYLACVVGIARVGAVGGLINTNLRGPQLAHCVREISANLSLVDPSGLEAMLTCRDAYLQASPSRRVIAFGCANNDAHSEPWLRDGDLLLQQASSNASGSALPVLAGDRALYIFTSGTTGWPKPAIITHQKFVLGAAAHAIFSVRARASDRFYICLPLYHGTGLMVGVAACLYSGASMFIRPKFSASALVEEANRYKCNVLIYVGEICRYLLNTPADDSDRKCALERAAGNGLRPDIWKQFKRRFGFKRIGEFYGASEANGGFLNVFNKDETIGVSGATVKLVRYAVEDASIIRDQAGFAAAVEPGEVGLLLFQVNEKDRFDGYTDQEQSKAKLECNVFEQGDCWFNSGDLLKQVDVGYAFNRPHYQFVDRLGDTFRWKSENVSTNEVAEVLCGFDSVALAAVYGVHVPGADGKAGMAALVLRADETELDGASFSAFVSARLPHYARPLFVRLKAELETTGTHKMLKAKLIEEGFDITRIGDDLLCWDRQTSLYVRLDRARYEAILAARAGY
jgi:citronellyl-CoA synthetase